MFSLFKSKKSSKCGAVVLAAGSSQRMGTDKMFMVLCGKPVVIRSLEVFEKSDLIDEIIVVTREQRIQELADLIHSYDLKKVRKVVLGGNTRCESSLAGISALSKDIDLVAIHDAARPFVTESLLDRTVEAAKKYMAAIPVIDTPDTVKFIDGDVVTATTVRETTKLVQTPQVFNTDIIKGALTHAIKNNIAVYDDSSAVDAFNIKTHVVEGDPNNIKLTYSKDVYFAEGILKAGGESL